MGYKYPMNGWALDLGTTNTGLAYWDESAERARLMELPTICRKPGDADPLMAPRLIPSATHLLSPTGFWDRLGRHPFFLSRTLWGRQAYIGRDALERNEGWAHPCFTPSFKGALGTHPMRTIARVQGEAVSARQVCRTFMRELVAEVHRKTGERLDSLVITVPVESYEQYRAELSAQCRAVGIDTVRFVDEPVAAAIGYGLSLRSQRRVLVVDFGGGTLDLAVVELKPRTMEEGSCKVIAKEGRPIGGCVVDQWLLNHCADALDLTSLLEDSNAEADLWSGLMLDEARRVKEAVYFQPSATFEITPPPELRARAQHDGVVGRYLDLDRDTLLHVLGENGMWSVMEDCLSGLNSQLQDLALSQDDIDDVLMVGGSTLLPGFFPFFEARFGRDRVRGWQPFEAVALGASVFAAGRFGQSDFIVHDYGFVTYDRQDHAKEYVTIIPKGTRFPTPPDIWKRQLVPTCALGEPESVFKLVICEIARGEEGRNFAWDADGNLHRLADGESSQPLIVPLNGSNPTLGRLNPPHQPDDHTPRLEVSFGVNENRWLITNVRDLEKNTMLMEDQPVIRLL